MEQTTVKYNGKKYSAIRLTIQRNDFYPECFSVLIAPESLSDAFIRDNGKDDPHPWGSEACKLDEDIYYYVPDEVIAKADGEDIAKNHLDEKFIYVPGCDYQGYEFGAGSYPDSVCVKGYLYDADSWDGEGYTSPQPDEEKIPCPKCNQEKYKEYLEGKSEDDGEE